MTKPLLLLVDNDDDFLLITGKYLEKRGYNIITSRDFNDACGILQKEIVCAVLIDLRLEDDSNPNDISGWDLACLMSDYSSVPKFIFTNFKNYEIAAKVIDSYQTGKRTVNKIILKDISIEDLISELENELMPKKIFLSYVSEDRQNVDVLYKNLKRAGYHPWMDIYDIVGGEKWEYAIEKAIGTSDFFLICLSKQSLTKRSFYRREINIALDLCLRRLEDDIFLIPVKLEPCNIEDTRLERFQWIEMYKSDGINNLLQALRRGGERYLSKEK